MKYKIEFITVHIVITMLNTVYVKLNTLKINKIVKVNFC